jgi:2-methylaconitate cis-trans-isomerase PrpF
LGTGVVLDFLEPEGSKTGTLLPTGNVVDTLCGVEASCVDAANPCVFVRAGDMGLDPTILPNEFLKEKGALEMLERIRTAAAVKMGLCKEGETPPRVIPKIGIVSPPVEQTTLSGAKVTADQLDLVARIISDAQPHRAIPVTAALCTAAAAKTEGTIVQQCLRDHLVDGDMITIGHPSGRIQVNAQKDESGRIASCSLVRTARRIWDGRIYWSEDPNLASTKLEEQDELKESLARAEPLAEKDSLVNNAFIQQDDGSEFDIEAPRTMSQDGIAQLEAQLKQVEKDLHKGDLQGSRS